MKPKSFVYFIQSGQDKVKIGVTTDINSRIKSINTASIDKLDILGIVVGDKLKEQYLHTLFADLRLRGEWFKAEPRILEWIKKHTVTYYPSEHRCSNIDGRVEQVAEMSILLKRIAQRSPIPIHRIGDRVAYVQSVLPSMKPSRITNIWYLIDKIKITPEEMEAIRTAANEDYISHPRSEAGTDAILAALSDMSTRISVLERAFRDVRHVLNRLDPTIIPSAPIPEEGARLNG